MKQLWQSLQDVAARSHVFVRGKLWVLSDFR